MTAANIAPMMGQLLQLQAATREARARTGDNAIGTEANAGRVRVVRVTYNARGVSTVRALSDWLSISGAVAILSTLA